MAGVVLVRPESFPVFVLKVVPVVPVAVFSGKPVLFYGIFWLGKLREVPVVVAADILYVLFPKRNADLEHSVGVLLYEGRKVKTAGNVLVLHRILPFPFNKILPNRLSNAVKLRSSVKIVFLQELNHVVVVDCISLNKKACKVPGFYRKGSALRSWQNVAVIQKAHFWKIPVFIQFYGRFLAKSRTVRTL